jgi:hypothetical protein
VHLPGLVELSGDEPGPCQGLHHPEPAFLAHRSRAHIPVGSLKAAQQLQLQAINLDASSPQPGCFPKMALSAQRGQGCHMVSTVNQWSRNCHNYCSSAWAGVWSSLEWGGAWGRKLSSFTPLWQALQGDPGGRVSAFSAFADSESTGSFGS